MTLSHASPAPGHARLARLLPVLKRYAVAIGAPASVAAVQLAMQLLLFRALPPAGFGLFAFLMVVVQFGLGLSNALVCTPYTVLAQRPGFSADSGRTFFTVNLLFAAAMALAATGIGMIYGSEAWLAAFAAYTALAMLRWFARAHAYAEFRPLRAAASDLAYAATLAIGLGLLWSTGSASLLAVSATLAVATATGIAVIGGEFIGRQFRSLSWRALGAYLPVWRGQSRWALLGVATTEATSNAHSYIVTALAGPQAFAPLAAAALFMKPVALAITSLTQLERPVIGKAIAAGDGAGVQRARRQFHAALAAAWLVTAVAAAALLWLAPHLLLRPGYDLGQIALAVAFFAGLAAIQAQQAPNSVLLQAADRFRLLASFSLKACLISVAAAAALAALCGPVWSLAGILAGQALMTVQISRCVKEWRNTHG